MTLRETTMCAGSVVDGDRGDRLNRAPAQAGTETFTATATVKTAGGAAASAPVTITVDRKMSQSEVDKLTAAFTTGGVAGLRKALVGVPPTGSVRLGAAAATPTRLDARAAHRQRPAPHHRDRPADRCSSARACPAPRRRRATTSPSSTSKSTPRAAARARSRPAAKVTVKQGVFVVEDYASELVRLTGVSKVK